MFNNKAQYKKSVGFFGWLKRLLLLLILAALGIGGYWFYERNQEIEVMKKMISNLTAEERVAEVWVEDYQRDGTGRPSKVRLKILEYGSNGEALKPVYCDFSLNDIIHFEALLIRLNDELILNGEGKSIYLFRRAYALDDKGNTYESCDIARPLEVPGGYSLQSNERKVSEIEKKYWESFWLYALDEKAREKTGIKNAQIEAPATKFLPDKIYRLVLEHDGGLRIQASPVPDILKGEHVKLKAPDSTQEVPQ